MNSGVSGQCSHAIIGVQRGILQTRKLQLTEMSN